MRCSTPIWTHLGFNAVWLLAFGSPVARRFGDVALPAVLHGDGRRRARWRICWRTPATLAPMVGASAGDLRHDGGGGALCVRARRLARLVARRSRQCRPRAGGAAARGVAQSARAGVPRRVVRAQSAVRARLGVDVAGDNQSVAWEAHVGGFLAGLLLFSRVRSGCAARRSRTNTADIPESEGAAVNRFAHGWSATLVRDRNTDPLAGLLRYRRGARCDVRVGEQSGDDEAGQEAIQGSDPMTVKAILSQGRRRCSPSSPPQTWPRGQASRRAAHRRAGGDRPRAARRRHRVGARHRAASWPRAAPAALDVPLTEVMTRKVMTCSRVRHHQLDDGADDRGQIPPSAGGRAGPARRHRLDRRRGEASPRRRWSASSRRCATTSRPPERCRIYLDGRRHRRRPRRQRGDRLVDLVERALGGARADLDGFLRAVEIEPARSGRCAG